jgi:hypothetical protein
VDVGGLQTGGEGFLEMRNGLVELVLFNSRAFLKFTMASSSLPWRASATPRLVWASAA